MEEGAGSKDAAGSKRKVLEVDASLVAATKRPKKPERNMGLDPFQVLALSLSLSDSPPALGGRSNTDQIKT